MRAFIRMAKKLPLYRRGTIDYSKFLTFTFICLFLYFRVEGNPMLLALPKNFFMSLIVWIQIQNLLPIHPCVSFEYVPF